MHASSVPAKGPYGKPPPKTRSRSLGDSRRLLPMRKPVAFRMVPTHDGAMSKITAVRRVALYARVSTDKQSTENQLRELREVASRMGWQVLAEFVDRGISGAKGRRERPQLDAMLRGVARKDFDLVASWAVDRLGRSLVDLIGLLQELHSTGVDLYLHQQGINTTTPAGKALFQMMGVFAEFEREMIRERVAAGLARAKAKGTKSGNPVGRPSVGAEVEQRIRELRGQGLGMLKIAKAAGCGVSVVQRVLAATRARGQSISRPPRGRRLPLAASREATGGPAARAHQNPLRFSRHKVAQSYACSR
jgi:DNA invertase Pin-like site-specific DNA recombinase